MPHNWFACVKGLWQTVLSVFCILSIFKLFWPQFLSILLAITRDSVDIQMSTVPHFKAYDMWFLQGLMSSRRKIDVASATG